MAPFFSPVPVVTGLKERVESLTVQGLSRAPHARKEYELTPTTGDKLYAGTSTGSILVYKVADKSSGACASLCIASRCSLMHVEDPGAAQSAELIETKKSVSRRSIEQLGTVPDIASLVVLSGMELDVYSL